MKALRRILALGPVAALPAAAGYLAARLKMSKPRNSGTLSLPCLEGEVEVIFDRAGIPHITAGSRNDAFRALGFVMAQDRMLQMQMMLRIAGGRLSEVIGRMGLEMDRFMRTIDLERAAERFAGHISAESAEALTAFCEGINAYLSRGRLRLPFEFMFLKGRPEPWRPADCLLLGLFDTWLLDSMWPADVMRGKLFWTLGIERAMELLPETAEYNNPPVKSDGPVATPGPVEPGELIDWDLDATGCGGDWCAWAPSTRLGSNNWVLGGSRTATGKPILAGDPHIQHNAPGMLYLCHLKTPDNDVIGAAFPGLPVIAFGHNGYCGWSVTSLCPDTQDLYVETFEDEESDRYRFKEEWLDAEVEVKEIKVRFGKPRYLKVVRTVHGPVIMRKGARGLALKWVSHDTDRDSLGAFLKQNRARSWEEFVEPMCDFFGPAMNQVYADVDGNIGYQAVAKVPRRARGDGSVPRDGASGQYEWEGYIPFERMPRTLNPDEGFLVTANSKIVGEGYPELITRAWEAPYRNGRISELLRSGDRWSVDELARVHADVFTFPGRSFARAAVDAARGRELTPAVAQAIERLAAWDHQARADSPAMSIYFYSWERLREKLLRHRLGSKLFDEYVHGWTTPNLAVENILEKRDPYWLPLGLDSYETVILESLEEALAQLEGIFGTSDQSRWEWGRIHSLTCQSLIGLFWPLNRIFNVGPVPRDGEGDTVNAAPPASDCLSQLVARGAMGCCTDNPLLPDCGSNAAYAGPVLRLLIDFADLDNSRAVLDVGQSGHRLSRHYKDHFNHWCKVDYLPLPYSREKILAEEEGTLKLTP